MVAGNGGCPPKCFGYVVTNETLEGVQKRATPEQQLVIDEYRERYRRTFGQAAHGLHYLPGLTVWLPPEEGSVEGEPEGVALPE